jgi:hypothetical protein
MLPTDCSRRSFLMTGLAAVGATMAPSPHGAAAELPSGSTLAFFVVSDTHYEAPQDEPESLDPHLLEINRRAIDLLNHLPGSDLPEKMGGGKVGPIRGVIHLGDMIESGDKGNGAVALRRQKTEWHAYVGDYGLTGTDGRLKYPVYEVHGNHDSVRELNVVIEGMIERNKRRPGVTHLSPGGLHYSWDWEGIHFVALGIVVGHNDKDLPIGRYRAHDSLQFLKEDLARNVGDSGRPIILLHHIDLLRYSQPCDGESAAGGEWSACDVSAYWEAIQGYHIAAIFHGHLHGLRTERWDGSSKSAETGIPVFGSSNTGAGGGNRGFFYCAVEEGNLVIREMVSLRTPDGWSEGTAQWAQQWKVPLNPRP